MANTVLIGAQWGDEGKGKIIDVLTEGADYVVRYQGGNNAGHTVELATGKFVLHLVPSGILRPSCVCVIGNGVVVDPQALVEEIDGLVEAGIDLEQRLFISERAHIVFPYHRLLDELREELKGGRRLGTTKRGIGPAYADKAARVGVRMSDLRNPALFRERLAMRVGEVNDFLVAHGRERLDFERLAQSCLDAAVRLLPMTVDAVRMVNDATARGRNVLLEGAQGTLLDLDHGTYPFVTSSHTTACGACAGAGLAPHRIDSVVGVMKAYTTRVGEGPFPTEDEGLTQHLHALGREFGATTGRPRRCGWLDAVGLEFAVMVNGIDRLALTNLDGLDGLASVRIATQYELDGCRTDRFPSDAELLGRCRPVFEEWPGWSEPTSKAHSWEELPAAARAYLERIEALTGVPIALVSVGARRDQTIRR